MGAILPGQWVGLEPRGRPDRHKAPICNNDRASCFGQSKKISRLRPRCARPTSLVPSGWPASLGVQVGRSAIVGPLRASDRETRPSIPPTGRIVPIIGLIGSYAGVLGLAGLLGAITGALMGFRRTGKFSVAHHHHHRWRFRAVEEIDPNGSYRRCAKDYQIL